MYVQNFGQPVRTTPLFAFSVSSDTSTVLQIEGPDWTDYTQAIPVCTANNAAQLRHYILLLPRIWPSLLPYRL
jgi:hypothetical protein